MQAVDSLGVAGDPVTLSFTPAARRAVGGDSADVAVVDAYPVVDDHEQRCGLRPLHCNSAVPVSSCGSTVQLNLAGLVDGTYSVVVQAVDSLGVAGDPVTLSFTLLPAAPTVVTPPTSPASTRTPSWMITNSDVDFDHYMCNSAVQVLSCTSTMQLNLAGLVDGTYSVVVQAVDSLGVAGDPVTLSFTLLPAARRW